LNHPYTAYAEDTKNHEEKPLLPQTLTDNYRTTYPVITCQPFGQFNRLITFNFIVISILPAPWMASNTRAAEQRRGCAYFEAIR